ncbi:hypothetical protein WJ96_01510 [Burkholderia ubonensis]|uniref:Uncharacterized protein n=1 Tax=Burkholderia ubonensis TaxID=101571 RepID=A0AAW3MLL6_9BURK|nr:hypothetical protein [Burkholderia ubonensis]KVP87669.1 hypothetical protein WJ96_01510 [Burkholderia ubonensis]
MVRDNNRTAAAHDKVIVIGDIIKVTDEYLIDHFVTVGSSQHPDATCRVTPCDVVFQGFNTGFSPTGGKLSILL